MVLWSALCKTEKSNSTLKIPKKVLPWKKDNGKEHIFLNHVGKNGFSHFQNGIFNHWSQDLIGPPNMECKQAVAKLAPLLADMFTGNFKDKFDYSYPLVTATRMA